MQGNTPSINQPAAAGPWYTHRWPWLLMLGPAVVVVAACYTGWVAYKGQDALVVDDYYTQGKAINQDLRRDHEAARLGVHTNLSYDAAQGVLHGKVTAQQGAMSGPLQVNLVHSTMPERDQKLHATPDSNGNFSVSLPMLERSEWQVLVEDVAHTWRLTGSWAWPKQEGISLSPELAPAE